MENASTSTSSQRLDRTFETLIESPEAEITSIPVLRPKQHPGRRSLDIPVSVQELVYGSKAEGVEISSKLVDRENEISNSALGVLGPRKDTRASERMDPNVL
ncbi:hypothetical protein O181_060491 [Austropuccinia psidii MF-1]|uniref:Uncharacterized protein n=1 Tax=Austropuccinia psidii MF-1 TaxID=1389203 RepID=A0A9Q3EL11_9BASI|nr:hypothetical protein [Austropuccinia psidii MF-1]